MYATSGHAGLFVAWPAAAMLWSPDHIKPAGFALCAAAGLLVVGHDPRPLPLLLAAGAATLASLRLWYVRTPEVLALPLPTKVATENTWIGLAAALWLFASGSLSAAPAPAVLLACASGAAEYLYMYGVRNTAELGTAAEVMSLEGVLGSEPLYVKAPLLAASVLGLLGP